MKKLLGMLVALAMVFMLIPGAAKAAEGVEIGLNAPEKVAPQAEFDVTVEIKSNPGFMFISLVPDFDSDVLELKGMEAIGSGWEIAAYANFDSAGDTDMTGEVLKLSFAVKEGVTDGATATISMTVRELYDENEADLLSTSTPATVKIECPHEELESSVTKEATCKEKGETTFTCKACHKVVKTEPIDKKEHTWNEGVVTTDPTCEEKGVKTFTCTVCSETKTEDIDALGHKHGEAVKENEVPAACEKDGSYDEVVYCTVCEKEVSRETKTITAPGHTYDEGVVIVDPSCEEDGVKQFTCKVCEEKKDEKIPALGHDMGEAVVIKEATCQEEGEKKATCSRCNEIVIEKIEKLEHKWDEGKVEVEPEVGKEGKKVFTCEVCKETKEEVIPALEEPSQEGSSQEESKQEESSQEESKQEESKQEESKQEESKQEESKQEESQASETQAPATQAPETQAPATQAPATQAPQTKPAVPDTGDPASIALWVSLLLASGGGAALVVRKKK